MTRDVLVTSIHKGQFPVALLGTAIIIFIYRLPPESLEKLSQGIVDKLDKGDLAGWLLFVTVSSAWAIVSRRSKQYYESEIARIGKQKSELQRKLLGNDAPSSEDHD